MITPWKKTKEKLLNTGYRKILRRTFVLPNGQKYDFDIKKERPAVCIVALTKDKKVILTRQFRPGPEKILLELPGGSIDDKETPLKAAKRELLEETGFVGKFKFIGKTLDCAYSTLIRHNFIALDCRKVQEQKLDEREFAEVVLMPLAKFKKHLAKGQLTDVETGYLALDYLNGLHG